MSDTDKLATLKPRGPVKPMPEVEIDRFRKANLIQAYPRIYNAKAGTRTLQDQPSSGSILVTPDDRSKVFQWFLHTSGHENGGEFINRPEHKQSNPLAAVDSFRNFVVPRTTQEERLRADQTARASLAGNEGAAPESKEAPRASATRVGFLFVAVITVLGVGYLYYKYGK